MVAYGENQTASSIKPFKPQCTKVYNEGEGQDGRAPYVNAKNELERKAVCPSTQQVTSVGSNKWPWWEEGDGE